MQNNRYFHIRVNLDETNVFDKSIFEINEAFENNRSKSFKNTSTVPYDLIENNNILNKEKGFLKFLDDISESEDIIDFNDLELRRKVIETINCNCYFLNARYWENIFEEVRKLNYNNLPSRKKCIYVCEGIEELSFWYEKLILQSGSEKAIIYELELDEKKVFKCDANILELGILPDEDIKTEARKYWSGSLTDSPEIENLYIGRVKTLNKYNTIEEILSLSEVSQL